MKTIEYTITTSDGLHLYTICWLPENSPKAIIIIVHGYAEHITRYHHIAQLLVQNGYAVYGLDHRGHGKSEGLRAHFDDFDQPVKDLKQFIDTIKQQYPNYKFFLYGHSMGSLVSGLFLLKYQNLFDGWICTGTTVNLDELAPNLIIALGNLLRNILPKANFVPFSSKGISSDLDVVKAYDNDPLVYRRPIRIRISADMVEKSRYLRNNAHKITLPSLLAHGYEDTITPPSGSYHLCNTLKSEDKVLKIYDGFHHEIHNEPEKELFFKDLLDWLDAHVNAEHLSHSVI